MMRLR
jgi:threonine dehydrogenase-like Zn-dependent dehydrogenase